MGDHFIWYHQSIKLATQLPRIRCYVTGTSQVEWALADPCRHTERKWAHWKPDITLPRAWAMRSSCTICFLHVSSYLCQETNWSNYSLRDAIWETLSRNGCRLTEPVNSTYLTVKWNEILISSSIYPFLIKVSFPAMAMEKHFVVNDTHTKPVTAIGFHLVRREIITGYEGV